MANTLSAETTAGDPIHAKPACILPHLRQYACLTLGGMSATIAAVLPPVFRDIDMQNLDYHIRNYKLIEKSLQVLFDKIVIDKSNFEQLQVIDVSLIYDIVPTIESLAKELHQELSAQFPDLPAFNNKYEKFDKDALRFLDKAFHLSTKQIKITSKQLLLSEEQRLLTPLQGAHEAKANHPKWSELYQNFKHDQANTQRSNLSTAKDVLEAAGAAFILLVVAQSLPFKEKRFTQCNLTFDSDFFEATYTRPLFTTFNAPLRATDLQLAPNWQQALFVVKDPERYIVHLCNKQQTKNKQFREAIINNKDFLLFLKNLPEERKESPLALILHWYGEETQNAEQKEWTQHVKDLPFSTSIEYFTAWANDGHALLSRANFDPLVAFNNYKDAASLYDFAKLNQDLTKSKP